MSVDIDRRNLLRQHWRSLGGRFQGANRAVCSIPESVLLSFLDRVISSSSELKMALSDNIKLQQQYQDAIGLKINAEARVSDLEVSMREIILTEESYSDEQTVLGEIYAICRQQLEQIKTTEPQPTQNK